MLRSLLADASQPSRVFLRPISWELVPDGVVASAGPGEQGWRAVLALEGVATGDGRFIQPDALVWRDLPLTLSYQDTIPDGMNPHAGATAAGRIESITRNAPNIDGEGAFTADAAGQLAADAVRTQKVRGVSVDLDMIQSEWTYEIDTQTGEVISEQLSLIEGRIMGAIVTPYPAFAEALIETVDTSAMPAADAAPIAAAAPLSTPLPAAYFANPDLDDLTPLTRSEPDEHGFVRIFGHIAPRDQCHVGYPNSCVKPPPSLSGYAFFHTGEVETDAGPLAVGRLTFGGMHANPRGITWREAQRHYEDIGTVGAHVRAGEDEFGIWISGVMEADLTDEQWRMFGNACPSGDWRDVRQDGTLEMIGVHQVATPGFPVPRAMTASAVIEHGQVIALIASGVPRAGCADEPVDLAAEVSALRADNARLSAEVARQGKVLAALARWGDVTVPQSL